MKPQGIQAQFMDDFSFRPCRKTRKRMSDEKNKTKRKSRREKN